MEKIPLVFRVVTPMLSTGQDGKTPELRASSFRGMLRWWFRTIAGNYIADPLNLRNYENRLFGGPVLKDGRSGSVETNASSFQLSIGRINSSLVLSERHQTSQPLLPHKPQRNRQSWADCIPIETFFELHLDKSQYTPTKIASQLAFSVDVVKSILDVAACLGGVGKRSRRTFGGFQPLAWQYTDQTNVVQHIGGVISEGCQLVKKYIDAQSDLSTGQPPVFSTSSISTFPVLNANVAAVKVGEIIKWVEPESMQQAQADWFLTLLMRKCHDLVQDHTRVLGSGRPRQASTLHVSMFKPLAESPDDRLPVYTQFYCNTVTGVRGRFDFDEINKLPADISGNLNVVRF